MTAWLDHTYALLFEGAVLLAENPVACAAVSLLRKGTIVLVSVVLLVVVLEISFVRSLKRRGPRWTATRALRLFERCRDEAGVPAAVVLRIAPEDLPPAFSSGILAPAVFLSPDLESRLDDQELAAVLHHELAHVARRDALLARAGRVGLLLAGVLGVEMAALGAVLSTGVMHFGSRTAVLVIAVSVIGMFFLLRRAGTVLSRHAEICCDERAVALGVDSDALAEAIVRAAAIRRTRRPLPIAALSGCRSVTTLRIRRLTGVDAAPSRLVIDRRVRMIALVLLATLVLYVGDFHRRSAVSTNEPMGWSGVVVP